MYKNLTEIGINEKELEKISQKLCRTCLKKENESKSIFLVDDLIKKTYAEIVMAIAPVVIPDDETYLSNICADCINCISSFYNFQQQCIQIDAIIRKNLTPAADGSKEKIIDIVFAQNFEEYVKQNISSNHSYSVSSEEENKADILDTYQKYSASDGEKVVIKTSKTIFGTTDSSEKSDLLELASNYSKRKTNYCNICKKRFKSRKSFLFHIKKQHLLDSNLLSTNPDNKLELTNVLDIPWQSDQELEIRVKKINANRNISNEKTLANKKREIRNLYTEAEDSNNDCNKINKSAEINYLDTSIVSDEEFETKDDNKINITTGTSVKRRKWTEKRCAPDPEKRRLVLELAKHYSKDKNNYCDACKKAFPSQNRFFVHIRRVHIDTKKPCDICNKLYYPSNLQRHKKIHFDIKDHVCEICGKKYNQKYMLEDHKFGHYTNIEKSIPCLQCGKSFVSKRRLFAHTYGVHKNKNKSNTIHVKCQICCQSFSSNGNLNNHLKNIHTVTSGPVKKRSYQCNVCGKMLTQKASLNRHLLVHKDEKPYQCEICSKTFRQLADLKTHRRIHSGEKPYNCEFCTKSFRHRTAFNDHKRSHSGEKPYRCKICDRSFHKLNNLKNHLVNHQ